MSYWRSWLQVVLAQGRVIHDLLGDFLDFVVGVALLGHLFADFPIGVHDGGVVFTSEVFTNLRQAKVGQLAAQVHGDLSRMRNSTCFTCAAEGIRGNLEVGGCCFHDGRGVRFNVADAGNHIAQSDFCQFHVDGLVDQRRVRGYADQSAFEFANGGGETAGDKFQDVAPNDGVVDGRFFHQDGDACFEVWWLNVGDQATFEASAQAISQGGELLGGSVGGEDDLFVCLVECVEGVEKFLLGSLFTLEELDVVNHQDVEVAVAPFEAFLAVVADGVDVVVGEFLAGYVADA